MKLEFAENKAMIRVAFGSRLHSGVNYIFQVMLAQKDIIYNMPVFHRGCIQWFLIRLSV